MSVHKVYIRLIILFAVLLMCLPAAAAEVIEASLPERVEISIIETDDIKKLGKNEYTVAVYPDWEDVVINGVWDGESEITITLNADGCVLADRSFERNEDGTWQCIIPVDILTPNARNYFTLKYADGNQEAVSCEIIVDFMCELELDDVYAAENRVTGTTEPGAEVYMFAGETEYQTVTGDDGLFWFDVDFSEVESTDGWYVRAVDIYGNSVELEVGIIDAEITVSAPELVNSEKVRVDISAISGSSVQLVLNGENWGEPVYIGKNGKGHAFVTGLAHDGEYAISAAYSGEFAGYAEPAQPVSVIADMKGPTLEVSAEFLYVGENEIELMADEECTLAISEVTTGFTNQMACKTGSNIVNIGELIDLEYGMEISIYAQDSAGNMSAEPINLAVRLPERELVHFENGTLSDGYTTDAMETFDLECVVYVPDAECELNLYMVDEDTGAAALLNSEPFAAVEAAEGAVLPAMIPVKINVDANELPIDHNLAIGFCTIYSDGETDDIALWPKLCLTLEKNYAKLTVLLILLVLAMVCFAVAARLYVRINKKQRDFKRHNGNLKDGRRGRKRGGVWA